ncbi:MULTISPECIES: hypothetical protein [unclassified Myxococcus]|uniref:hypothetical protein n=1 Tax=unclassified Myxococcus TaxID=2648731 RepID=UPI00157ACEAE|nr:MULTISPECIES: hypothetical protein [unclassified Myxococcus]NTX34082.1 hypothetical protein [Myxococcus sp. CA033]NTX56888.1 hypothetical protein [Myxococcus sp. CA039A]
MKRATRIRQSAIRVRSGSRLALFLLALCLCAMFFSVTWAAKTIGILILYVAATTALEAWNVWRLSRLPPKESNRS